jgi:hypothetical protein
MPRAHLLCFLLALGLAAAPAAAAPPDQKTRDEARAIGAQALSLFDAGKYEDALKEFDRADTVFRAPTHGLMAARCLVKLGRLFEASERYMAVTQMDLGPDPSEAFRTAKVEAARELEALLPRIPTISVEVKGQATSGVAFFIDGSPVDSIRSPRPVDPGKHRIEARLGDAVLSAEDVTLAEQEKRTVTLTLGSQAGDSLGPTEPSGASGQTQRILGWVGIGLGGAGLVLGGVTGGLALGAQGDLDDSGCRDGVCPKAVEGDVDSYNTFLTLSTIGFIGGGVALAAGTVLLLTAPKAREADRSGRVSAVPWIGLGSAGVRGTF